MTIATALLLGAVTWSLLEYVIHRWLGHKRRFAWNLFAAEHLRHHHEGNYFAPTWKKIVAALISLALLATVAVAVAGVDAGVAYASGFVGFYAFYEWQHRRNHSHAPWNFYGREARRHHFTHHFGDARVNHGVTSPVWDLVFNTYRRPTVICVPERLAMPWLIDPLTRRVREDFSRDYSIRPSASQRP